MRSTLIALAAGTALVAGLALPASADHGALTVTGLTANDRLVTFKASAPDTVLSETRVTGLASDEDLASIDFRPNGGALYGIGVSERGGVVYTIDTLTGVATAVPGAPLIDVRDQVSIDVNPSADALRIVDSTGTNRRLRFVDNVLLKDGALAYADGTTPTVGAVAYTKNTFPSTGTTLYDIDAATDALLVQNPPNAGGVAEVGDLVAPTKAQATGFDVYTRTNRPGEWAFLSVFDKGRSTFYEIDLASGQQVTATTPVPGSGRQIGTTPHVTDIALAPAQAGF